MSLVGRRLSKLKPSETVALAGTARELIAAGRDVIDLAEGEPDFDTPRHIVDAAIAALKQGETRYTAVAGTAELKAAIQEKFRRDNGLTYEPEQIIAGTGAKQIIFNALMCSLDPDDEVIIPTPAWVSYRDIVTLCDATPVEVSCAPQSGFKLQVDDLASAITPQTKWLVLNSPCNPTGATYDTDELRAIAEVLHGHPRVGVLCDDIYEHLTYGDTAFATMAAAAPDLTDRVLTVNGVSKAYAMTGWRIGYGAGPSDLIAAMATLQGQSTTHPSAVCQAAAAAALTGPQALLDSWRHELRERRDFLHSSLSSIDGLDTGPPPQGAFYLFPSCADLIGRTTPDGKKLTSDGDISAYLMSAAGVASVPGSAFGCAHYLRLCFARPEPVLRDAADRISAACAALK